MHVTGWQTPMVIYVTHCDVEPPVTSPFSNVGNVCVFGLNCMA